MTPKSVTHGMTPKKGEMNLNLGAKLMYKACTEIKKVSVGWWS